MVATEYSMLYVTFPNIETGKKIANNLLRKRMATFINMIPSMMTIYQRNTSNQQQQNANNNDEEIDAEILMLAKIRTSLSLKILHFVDQLHPYDLPEMYTVPIYYMNPTLQSYLDANLAKHI